MNYVLLAVRDMKAKLYNRPMCDSSIPSALRSWEMAVNDGDSIIRKFPNDFRLHHLGTVDAETGEMTIFNQPSDLGSAADFLRQPAAPTLPFNDKQ